MEQRIYRLLNEVAFKMGTLREARSRFSAQLAPEFRIFDYLRTDEMGLSRCIASLLDPKGRHGQGRVFLDALLKRVGSVSDWATNTDNCVVIMEKQANGQRRIDIYLDFQKDGIIGIENKPWAGDQGQQLADYAAYLEKEAGLKKWLLIYLSNRDPSKESIGTSEREEYEKSGHYVRLTYADLIKWLEECACKSKATNVRVFIEELAKIIRTSINGELDMSEEQEIKSIILKSTENLASAFQISNTINAVREELLKLLRIELESSLKCHAMVLDWNLEGSRKNIGFNIQFGENPQKLCLRFQFEESNLDGFFWGIARKDVLYSDPQVWAEVNKLMSANFASKESSKHWPWYSDRSEDGFSAEFNNWTISAYPWMAILDKKSENNLAEKITTIALHVRDVFQEHSFLLQEGRIQK